MCFLRVQPLCHQDPTIEPRIQNPQQEGGCYLSREELDTVIRMKAVSDMQLAEWARGCLAPETSVSPGESSTRSLLTRDHVRDWAQALRERDGRFFFLSHHLHGSWVTIDSAVTTGEEAVAALAWAAWRAGRGPRCSWLNDAASGHRPLAILTPECDSNGKWHIHGFLQVPPSITAIPERIREWLRRVPPNRHTSARKLHHDAVHLHQLHRWEVLRPYVEYATKTWGHLHPGDQRVVPAPFGPTLSSDWLPVNTRMEQLQVERHRLQRGEDYEVGVRTQILLEEGARRLQERAKKISSATKAMRRHGKPALKKPNQPSWTALPEPNPHRSYRNVAVLRRPAKRPELPREAEPTGPLDW